MKTLLLTLMLSLVLGFAAAQERVNVRIKQDYKLINGSGGVFTLKKSPFKFVFHVKGTDGFLIAFTQQDDIYRSAIGEADLEVMWFANTGMAEGLFNSEKSVTISDEAPSYWYFTGITEHRFDPHPQGTAQEWMAERSVDAFYLTEFSDTYLIKDMVRPLYFIIYSPTYDEDYNLIDKQILYHGQLQWK
ncbi:hypothetical protein ACS126_15925 [Sphingobacterium lactis]|uniref:hypothetical protein n=1 Tax=Sphingobacterium lactis TaxID=797291 RepID=UPI003EC95085